MSKIEVNEIDKQSGSTLTLGGSGTAVTLACGATQSGFGRTGTVDWQTGSVKTTDFTAVNGQGFFVDTNGGAVTATLPTGSAGSIVSIQDYRNTFNTANCTVQTAGSQKINSGVAGGKVILSTEGEGITLVYIDSTVGWRSIQDNDFASASVIPTFISATGGTVSTVCTNFKVHTFTGPGTFCVSAVGNASGSNTVDYLVVAGGGGAGRDGGGGGGAGGYRESSGAASGCYSKSPLGACVSALPVSVTAFPITVGGGGGGAPGPAPGGGPAGTSGSNSIFSTITSTGGGGGGTGPGSTAGISGGSGGGGARACVAAGSGNTPSVSPPQGNNGGAGAANPLGGSGGGGATAVGSVSTGPGGAGGAGGTTTISGSPTAYAGGGGGGAGGGGVPGGAGGSCVGAIGNVSAPLTNIPSTSRAAAANTGGGGGGESGSYDTGGGAGGSGIVIIRYKFQ